MMTIMRDPMRDIYRGVEIENRSPFDFFKGIESFDLSRRFLISLRYIIFFPPRGCEKSKSRD